MTCDNIWQMMINLDLIVKQMNDMYEDETVHINGMSKNILSIGRWCMR